MFNVCLAEYMFYCTREASYMAHPMSATVTKSGHWIRGLEVWTLGRYEE